MLPQLSSKNDGLRLILINDGVTVTTAAAAAAAVRAVTMLD